MHSIPLRLNDNNAYLSCTKSNFTLSQGWKLSKVICSLSWMFSDINKILK